MKINKQVNEKNNISRNLLIESNIYLIEYVIKDFLSKTYIDIDEVTSYAYEGLIYAAEKIHNKLNCDFSTYAYQMMKKNILNNLSKNIGIDSNILMDYINLKDRSEKNNLGLTDEEIILSVSKQKGYTSEHISEILNKYNKLNPNYMSDLSEEMFSYDSNYISDRRIDINNAITKLNIKDRLIIQLHYGLTNNGKQYNYEEIANILNVYDKKYCGKRKFPHTAASVSRRIPIIIYQLKEHKTDDSSAIYNQLEEYFTVKELKYK